MMNTILEKLKKYKKLKMMKFKLLKDNGKQFDLN